MKQYDITLANDTAIFDAATFDDLADAIDWAKGRGGQYHVGIGFANFFYDTDADAFSRYNGDEWETIPENEIKQYI